MKCPICGAGLQPHIKKLECVHSEFELLEEIERLKKEIKGLKGDQCDPDTCNVECLK